jgi:hypothetical protein
VYFLDRTHQQWLHPSANRIPVLVLDYDQVPISMALLVDDPDCKAFPPNQ